MIYSKPLIHAAQGYAGNISAHTAYTWMQSGQATMVDIRTQAERDWVGYVPDAIAIEWKQYPSMQINPHFDEQIQQLGTDKPIVLLCRSGVRAEAAAARISQLGGVAYSIIGGFEGDLDNEGHRGNLGGWRHAGLPWKQK